MSIPRVCFSGGSEEVDLRWFGIVSGGFEKFELRVILLVSSGFWLVRLNFFSFTRCSQVILRADDIPCCLVDLKNLSPLRKLQIHWPLLRPSRIIRPIPLRNFYLLLLVTFVGCGD